MPWGFRRDSRESRTGSGADDTRNASSRKCEAECRAENAQAAGWRCRYSERSPRSPRSKRASPGAGLPGRERQGLVHRAGGAREPRYRASPRPRILYLGARFVPIRRRNLAHAHLESSALPPVPPAPRRRLRQRDRRQARSWTRASARSPGSAMTRNPSSPEPPVIPSWPATRRRNPRRTARGRFPVRSWTIAASRCPTPACGSRSVAPRRDAPSAPGPTLPAGSPCTACVPGPTTRSSPRRTNRKGLSGAVGAGPGRLSLACALP